LLEKVKMAAQKVSNVTYQLSLILILGYVEPFLTRRRHGRRREGMVPDHGNFDPPQRWRVTSRDISFPAFWKK